jgi:hypothetical protein
LRFGKEGKEDSYTNINEEDEDQANNGYDHHYTTKNCIERQVIRFLNGFHIIPQLWDKQIPLTANMMVSLAKYPNTLPLQAQNIQTQILHWRKRTVIPRKRFYFLVPTQCEVYQSILFSFSFIQTNFTVCNTNPFNFVASYLLENWRKPCNLEPQSNIWKSGTISQLYITFEFISVYTCHWNASFKAFRNIHVYWRKTFAIAAPWSIAANGLEILPIVE